MGHQRQVNQGKSNDAKEHSRTLAHLASMHLVHRESTDACVDGGSSTESRRHVLGTVTRSHQCESHSDLVLRALTDSLRQPPIHYEYCTNCQTVCMRVARHNCSLDEGHVNAYSSTSGISAERGLTPSYRHNAVTATVCDNLRHLFRKQ